MNDKSFIVRTDGLFRSSFIEQFGAGCLPSWDTINSGFDPYQLLIDNRVVCGPFDITNGVLVPKKYAGSVDRGEIVDFYKSHLDIWVHIVGEVATEDTLKLLPALQSSRKFYELAIEEHLSSRLLASNLEIKLNKP